MNYIKLEDVQNTFEKYIQLAKKNNYSKITIPMFEVVVDEINSLPSINPEALIEEMIEENYRAIENNEGKMHLCREYDIKNSALHELLQKFKS